MLLLSTLFSLLSVGQAADRHDAGCPAPHEEAPASPAPAPTAPRPALDQHPPVHTETATFALG